MADRGENTRERIFDIAQEIILQKGFGSTAIDEILERAHITKGGFFYHFKSKNELARHLMQRYLDQDDAFFKRLFERADTLSEDPLQQMLIFLKLFAEAMEDLEGTHPGCLVASYTYESQQFDETIRDLTKVGVLGWRRLFKDRLEAINEKYPMQLDTSLDEVADMLTSTVEGGIILSRVFGNQKLLAQQLLQFRNYVRLLFGNT